MATIQNDSDYNEIRNKAAQAYEKSVTGIGRLGHHYDLIDLLKRKCGVRTDRTSCVLKAVQLLNEYESEKGWPETDINRLA
jgi:hypothetical protein